MPPPLVPAVLLDTGLRVNVAAGAVPEGVSALARPPPLPVAVLPLRLLLGEGYGAVV